MDRMSALETFVVAVETGSLNQASQRMDVSQSAVSQQLRKLESHFGQTLLVRSPSGVRPTGPGQTVFARAQSILREYSHMIDDLGHQTGHVTGDLRIGISLCLQNFGVSDALVALKNTWPDLNLSLTILSQQVDLTRDPLDLAMVVGDQAATDGIVRKLGEIDTSLYAHPTLFGEDTPERIQDLKGINMVRCPYERDETQLKLNKDGEEISEDFKTGVSVNTPEMLVQAAVNRMGFAKLPTALAEPHVEAGDLIQLLPDHTVAANPIYLVYPERGAMTNTMRAVSERMYAAIKDCTFIKTV